VRVVGLLAGLLFSLGCATAGGEGDDDAGTGADGGDVDGVTAPLDASGLPIDAGTLRIDASVSPIDASVSPIDASVSPIDAAVPDAFVAASPDAAPCTLTWVSLLGNGNFDLGRTVWVETASNGAAIILSPAPTVLTPHSGAWVARHLGANNETETMAQSVTIPAGATGLRLRGYRCFVTQETGGVAYDFLTVRLREGGAAREVLKAWSNLDATAACNWSFFELVATNAYPGRTLELQMAATSDAASLSSLYLDTLALEAQVCQF